MGFVARACLEAGRPKEAIGFAASRLKLTPEDPVLLYYQAKALLELKMYDYGLALAKYACELSPESTSVWVLLAKAYIFSGNHKYVCQARIHRGIGAANDRHRASVQL